MRLLTRWLVSAAGLAVLGAGAAFAKDESLKAADLPKAVADAIQKKYPGATYDRILKEDDEGALRYEVKIQHKVKATEAGKQTETVRLVEIEIAAEGKILEEAERLDPAKLPEAVTKALKDSTYEGMKVVKIERVVKQENDKQARFDLDLQKGDDKHEIEIDAAGNVTEEDDDDEGDDDEDDDEDEDD